MYWVPDHGDTARSRIGYLYHWYKEIVDIPTIRILLFAGYKVENKVLNFVLAQMS